MSRQLLAAIAVIFVVVPVRAQVFLGKGTQEWVRELETGSAFARRNAAFALGKLGVNDGLRPLKKAVADPDAKVREAAAYALGDLGKQSIAASRDPELAPLLAKMLTDGEPLVRRSAAYALGCLGSDAMVAEPALKTALRDERAEVRQNAVWALGQMGSTTAPAVRTALGDGDPLVRRDAAAAMGQFEPTSVRPAIGELAGLCGDSQLETRKAAIAALVRVVGPEDTKVASAIHKVLNEEDEELKRNAAFALSNIGGKEAAPAVFILLDTLRRGNVDLRRQSATALRNIGPDAAPAVPELIKVLRDPDGELRKSAAFALGGIGPAAEPAVNPLVDVVANSDEKKETRVEAAVALSRIGDVPAAVKAVPTLLKVLTDASVDPQVRERIVWSLRVHNVRLRKIDGVFPAMAKVLDEIKSNNNRMLRYDCAYMIGVFQGPDAGASTLDTLQEFLKDETILIYVNKKSTVQGSGQETGSGKATVKEVGKDDGRVMAVQALTNVGAAVLRKRPDIVEQLRRIVADPKTLPELREDSRKLLEKIGS
ncbi:MAG: HEAT repeat domain-containing protein [Gemmataceae bacterium]